MATPTVEELVASDGSSGIYNKLLSANKAVIAKEFKEGRITKSDYATVLLGAMQNTMQMSMTFLLERDKVELMEAQIALTIKQGELIDAQVAESISKEALTAAQVLQVTQETEKASWETAAAKALVDGSDVVPNSIMYYQAREALYKQELMAAKGNTERAQTNAFNVDATSVIGRQNEIYKQQAESYIKDAKIKASQQMVDAWKIYSTVEEQAPANSILVATGASGKNHVLEAVNDMLASV